MGAIALVLLAVIVLPMVFDPEPRPVAPPVSVRIPGEDDAPFKPKPPPQNSLRPKRRSRVRSGLRPDRRVRDPENVTAKLAAAKIPHYTEAVAGNLTRCARARSPPAKPPRRPR